jgi:hypothetical protein
MDLDEIGYVGVDRIHVAQDKNSMGESRQDDGESSSSTKFWTFLDQQCDYQLLMKKLSCTQSLGRN